MIADPCSTLHGLPRRRRAIAAAAVFTSCNACSRRRRTGRHRPTSASTLVSQASGGGGAHAAHALVSRRARRPSTNVEHHVGPRDDGSGHRSRSDPVVDRDDTVADARRRCAAEVGARSRTAARRRQPVTPEVPPAPPVGALDAGDKVIFAEGPAMSQSFSGSSQRLEPALAHATLLGAMPTSRRPGRVLAGARSGSWMSASPPDRRGSTAPAYERGTRRPPRHLRRERGRHQVHRRFGRVAAAPRRAEQHGIDGRAASGGRAMTSRPRAAARLADRGAHHGRPTCATSSPTAACTTASPGRAAARRWSWRRATAHAPGRMEELRHSHRGADASAPCAGSSATISREGTRRGGARRPVLRPRRSG